MHERDPGVIARPARYPRGTRGHLDGSFLLRTGKGHHPPASGGVRGEDIQFRKVNLQDVLAASTGDDPRGSGSATRRAIAGILAGVITVENAENAPSVPALSIALAYQDGLEKAEQARLDVLTRTKALLEDQQNALLCELELLAVARRAIAEVGDRLSSGACAPRGFERTPSRIRTAPQRLASRERGRAHRLPPLVGLWSNGCKAR